MTDDIQTKIRNRAYEIWERDGRSGNPEDHWLEAEREIARESSAGSALAADAIGGPDRTAGVHAAETQPSARRSKPAAAKADAKPSKTQSTAKADTTASKADSKTPKASARSSAPEAAPSTVSRKKSTG